MTFRAKSLIKSVLPHRMLRACRVLLGDLPRTPKKRRARRIFAAAEDAPSFLDAGMLETLQMKYPPPPEYGYDARSVEERGMLRSREILRLPGARGAQSFLEIGCWDGMVSCCLSRKGKEATAIDNRSTGFDDRAHREGVTLRQMDASALRFEDETFDFVFSYDTFEHLASPEDALREAIRVVKRGGYVYLEFGPLYYSPFGEHARRTITVPYCQFLFEKGLINDFATRRRLDPIDFSHVNGWSIRRYRELWDKYSRVVERARYTEDLDLSHLSLISAFPSCFKSKSSYFADFIVSRISILLRKKH